MGGGDVNVRVHATHALGLRVHAVHAPRMLTFQVVALFPTCFHLFFLSGTMDLQQWQMCSKTHPYQESLGLPVYSDGTYGTIFLLLQC